MSQRMKVLIGYDGSPWADAALQDLRRAGLPHDVEAVVMSVADVFLPPLPPSSADRGASPTSARTTEMLRAGYPHVFHALEEARASAQRASEHLRTRFPSWDVRTEVCADSPAWALIKTAEAWKPDLIVVGSQGHSALGRMILGSVSQKVLAHARCAVRIARGRMDASEAPVRLVIGVDGSRDADAAVRVVAERQWPSSSEARVIMVLERPILPIAQRFPGSTEEERASAQQIVAGAAEPLRTAGLAVSTIVEEGNPKRFLPDEAERWHADSIFVGARGIRGIERFLLGSVSAAVAARAPCSVEVVRIGQHT